MSEAKFLVKSPFATLFLMLAIPIGDLCLRTLGYRRPANPPLDFPTMGSVTRANRECGEAYVQIGKRVGSLWSRLGGNGTCLRQAVAVKWLLAARGIPVHVVLGVRVDDHPPAAHAWLTYHGVALAEGDAGCAPLMATPHWNRDFPA